MARGGPLPHGLLALADSSNGVTPSSDPTPHAGQHSAPRKRQVGALQLALGIALLGLVSALSAALLGSGPGGFLAALSKSGFAAAFSLIFVSEIGDKTFFIAALLAMRHSRTLVLAGATSALGLMSVISVIIGRLFREVPAQLQTSIPIGEYLACGLLVWFGISAIRTALALPAAPPAPAGLSSADVLSAEAEEGGELAEAREYVEKAEAENKAVTPLAVFWEAFTLVFLAEWGDRSMLATIALGAAQSPVGVALGATWGHFMATAIAVLGGSLLSQHISERLVGLISGSLFFLFAAATLLGVF